MARRRRGTAAPISTSPWSRPRGTRLSWMAVAPTWSARTRAPPGESASASAARGTGTYYVEIGRSNPNDQTPISGRVEIDVLGTKTKTLDFNLTGERALIGQVSVVRRWRMESQRR